MSELVQKLAKGDHKVIFRPIGDEPVKELKECIDRDYVHIKFTETRGGTELGFHLDPERSDLTQGDFDNGSGTVTLAGKLTLDYVPVLCVGELDLGTMEGKGHLEIREEEPEPAEAD